MSSDRSQVKARGIRARIRSQARREAARSLAMRGDGLLSLEARTLLATLPASVFTPSPIDISGNASPTSNTSSPSIAIDPNNPNKLAAIWVRNDPALAPGPTEIVEAAYSNDAGKNWNQLYDAGQVLIDPTSSATAPVAFAQTTDASVAFDRNENFYFLYSEHNAGETSGALVLDKYSFASNSPNATSVFNNAAYVWGADAALKPALAVDASVANFTDTNSNGIVRSQSDPNSGNVYITFESNDTAPASLTGAALNNFDPNRIMVLASSDGGSTFSGVVPMNNNGGPATNNGSNYGIQREATPAITVSQGAAPRPAGTNGPNDPGSPGVSPGRVSVVWDDYGTGAKAAVPYDVLTTSGVTGTTSAQSFSAGGGVITPGGTGTPNVPVTTSFPIAVNISDPRFVSVSDMTVNLAILHPNLATISIVLVPPSGSGLQPITLLENQTNAAGTANQFVGVSGANLGIAADGQPIGTTFDDYATRNIVDFTNAPPARGAAAPFIGHFRPEDGSLIGDYGGASASKIDGTWTLQITDFRNTTPTTPDQLESATLNFTSGLAITPTHYITTTFTRAVQSGAATVSAAYAQGIAPTPQIASDNTLGAYSPYQGRLYVAYTDYLPGVLVNGVQNPKDNTDIFLAYSDNGGQTWTNPTDSANFKLPVNDDNAAYDGFSEGTSGSYNTPYANSTVPNSGRPQFLPSIAVDNNTGTVVMSWYDARNDAARARVAVYTTTSIDGGQTFSPDVYANASQTATDAITGKTVVLGPVPDNQSGGNSKTEATVGFGFRQGLAVEGGTIHTAWASNLDGGPGTTPLNLDIRTNTATFAAGPRIISSTQGPVGQPNDTLNIARGSDGGPLASAFQVTFDRPVDPATFSVGDVKVLYRDTTANDKNGGLVPVNSVVPINNGLLGATTFQVNFTPSAGVGTYSLEITSNTIRDRIRSIEDVNGQAVTVPGNLLDQNSNHSGGKSTDYYQAPAPLNPGTQRPFTGPYNTDSLPLIVPGPHVLSTSIPGQSATPGNLILNGTTNAIDVTFDRNMNPATFTPASILEMIGPAGPITGPFTVTPNPNGSDPNPSDPQTYQIGFPTQTLSGTYTLTLASSITDANGNALDTNLNAGLALLRGTVTGATVPVTYNASNVPQTISPGAPVSSTLNVPDTFLAQGVTVQIDVTAASDPGLQISLVSPTGTSVVLVPYGTGATGSQANFSGTVFSDTAATLIQNGGPPFYGSFKPDQPLSLLNGEQANGTWTLVISSNAAKTSGTAGTLNSWSLSFQQGQPSSGLGEPTADQASLSFRIFTMSPTNRQSATTWTAVGPASVNNPGAATNNGYAGRVGAITVDPSDSSGNTVYAAGASGGVWKTTDFLTTDPNGPTWIPLTDFGPTSGMNIGGLAVFGRNNDPRQSIIIAGTGNGASANNAIGGVSSQGVGFLISTDGGATWSLMDSTNNSLPFAQRDHLFAQGGGPVPSRSLLIRTLSPTASRSSTPP